MSVEENKSSVRRFYDEVWSKGNVEVASEVFAEDYLPTISGRRRRSRARGGR